MTDFSSKSDREIEQWIANHEVRGMTEAVLFRELLEERAHRSQAKHKLDLGKSLACIMTAARQQRCTTYGSLAEASGVEWVNVRRAMDGAGGHLDRLLDLCYARGLPLLTALVVSQGGVKTAELEPYALRGFCAGARRLGLSVVDEVAFHKEQRDASWAWGRSAAN